MAIEIYKQPSDIVFSGNPIILGVKDTYQIYSMTEESCVVRIFKGDWIIPPVGYNIEVGFQYQDITINNSIYTIPITNGMSGINFLETLFGLIIKNYNIIKHFYCVFESDSIYLIERIPLENLAVLIRTNAQYHRTGIEYERVTDSSQYTSTRQFGSHYIGLIPYKAVQADIPALSTPIMVDKPYGVGEEIESIPTITTDNGINKTYDGSLYVEKNIAGMLCFKQIGHFNISEIVKVYDIAKKFRMQCYRNNTDGISDITLSDYFYVIDAKINKNKQAELNELGTTIWQSLIDSKKFMTWAPNNKKIDVYQPELIYLPIKEDGTYTIHIREYYSTGGNIEHQLDAFSAKKYQIAMISAAYLNIRSDSSKIITKFDIWVQNLNNDIVSTTRTYYMDYSYQPYARWWLFKNSLGVYEVLRTTGKSIPKNNVSKKFIDKVLPNNYVSTDRDREQVSCSANYSMKVNSGPLKKEESLQFDELLTSNDVYLLLAGKALPVGIDSGKFPAPADGENINSKTFTVTVNKLDDQDIDLSSKLPILGDFSLDFGPKFFV